MAGSYLFAEMSAKLGETVMKVGDRGKLMLPEILRLPLPTFLLLWVPAIAAVLYFLNRHWYR